MSGHNAAFEVFVHFLHFARVLLDHLLLVVEVVHFVARRSHLRRHQNGKVSTVCYYFVLNLDSTPPSKSRYKYS